MTIPISSVMFWFPRIMGYGGAGILLVGMAVDRSWIGYLPHVLILGLATTALRRFNITLGKYSYLAPSGMVALSGMVLVGPQNTRRPAS